MHYFSTVMWNHRSQNSGIQARSFGIIRLQILATRSVAVQQKLSLFLVWQKITFIAHRYLRQCLSLRSQKEKLSSVHRRRSRCVHTRILHAINSLFVGNTLYFCFNLAYFQFPTAMGLLIKVNSLHHVLT